MKAKHTPGPWEARWRSGRCTTVVGRQRAPICDTGTTIDNMQRDEANAHLIAAAPDLLDACRAALLQLNGDRPELIGVTKVMLEDAIAKAEGADS